MSLGPFLAPSGWFMNANLSVKAAGMVVFLCTLAWSAQPQTLEGHADDCPLGGCPLAPPPLLDWPLDPPAPTVTLKVRVPACAAL